MTDVLAGNPGRRHERRRRSAEVVAAEIDLQQAGDRRGSLLGAMQHRGSAQARKHVLARLVSFLRFLRTNQIDDIGSEGHPVGLTILRVLA